MSAIQSGIDRANANAANNASKVQKWTVLPLDLSVSGGELGPTLKLKRFAVNKKFVKAIENFYE
jgi:long-chain-fatty-acid--CoA ligase ACSBG